MLLHSEPKIVIHGHDDLLLGAEVALGRLDRRMPQQELDLLEIATRLPAELGAQVRLRSWAPRPTSAA